MMKKYWKKVIVYLIALDIIVWGVFTPIAGIITWMSSGANGDMNMLETLDGRVIDILEKKNLNRVFERIGG